MSEEQGPAPRGCATCAKYLARDDYLPGCSAFCRGRRDRPDYLDRDEIERNDEK